MIQARQAAENYRHLCGASHTFRKALNDLSRAEEARSTGARERREDLSRQFHVDLRRAEADLAAVDEATADFRLAGNLARHRAKSFDAPQDSISFRVCKLARLGASVDVLARMSAVCAFAAEEGTQALADANLRKEKGTLNLEVSRHLVAVTDQLAKHGFDKSAEPVQKALKSYRSAANLKRDSQ